MTTVLDETQPGQPYTHALIIGVGAYSHLPGGSKYDTAPARLDFGLRQLTSPPISARYFADWLIRSFRNDDAPLGTVEMLLSEANPTPFGLPSGTQFNVEPATLDKVEQAFRRWYRRCDEHADNLALLYFCGHGLLVGGDQVLLAEDYGWDDLNEFAGAWYFEKTYKGMARCKAHLQCFFVDACDNVPAEARDIADAGARAFLSSSWPSARDPEQLVFTAAAPGSKANALPNQVSLFTEALVQSLEGRGCDPAYQSPWVVTTPYLVTAVNRIVAELSQGGPAQRPDPRRQPSREMPLHMRAAPPLIPVRIQFNPPAAIANANLELRSQTDPNWVQQRAQQPGEWVLNQVTAGVYQFRAQFPPPASYTDIDMPLPVLPPGPIPPRPISV